MYFYLLENESLCVKKIGITKDVSAIKSRYGKLWNVVDFFHSEDPRVVKRAEKVVLQAIRMAQNRRNLLSEIDTTSGYTETFSSNLASKKVSRLMYKALKSSAKIYKVKTRIVTCKVYNRYNGKLKSPRPALN